MRNWGILITHVGRSIGLLLLACVIGLPGCRSMVFHPVQNAPTLRQRYESNRFEIASHGQTIEGWQIENPAARNDLVILYFGGNAEDVLYTAGSVAKLDARQMFVTNYRGYGRSTGKAGERALYDDGRALYEYAISKGARPDRIVVMGRSLGSGVAAMLAGSREVSGAVLIAGGCVGREDRAACTAFRGSQRHRAKSRLLPAHQRVSCEHGGRFLSASSPDMRS